MKNLILIVDDDRDFTEAISVFLKANGYDTLTASGGKEAIQRVKDESPDLILLDMMMAYRTEGADIARIISEDAASKDTPVIIITGAGKEADFPSDLKAGSKELPVKAVIEKPVKPDELLNIIRLYIKKVGLAHRKVVDEISEIVGKWIDKRGNLVMILHQIQNRYGYIPRGISFELSRLLDTPLARIYEVITFYNYFKLNPPGKYTISLCMGTACYLKGANGLLNEFTKLLGIKEGETTADGIFHLQVVRCLGCCGLAPVVMIGEKVHGKVRKEDISGIISEYTRKAKE